MCLPGYHHNGFVTTRALMHMMYSSCVFHVMSPSVWVAMITGGHIVFIITIIYIIYIYIIFIYNIYIYIIYIYICIYQNIEGIKMLHLIAQL